MCACLGLFHIDFHIPGILWRLPCQVGCAIPSLLVNNSICDCPWTCADEAPQQEFQGQLYPVNCALVDAGIRAAIPKIRSGKSVLHRFYMGFITELYGITFYIEAPPYRVVSQFRLVSPDEQWNHRYDGLMMG